MAQLARICLQCRRPKIDSWVGKVCWRRDRLPTPIFFGFPCGSAGKESACNVADLGLILGLGRSPPLKYSGLENSMDCIVHGVQRVRYDSETFTFSNIFIECRHYLWVWWRSLWWLVYLHSKRWRAFANVIKVSDQFYPELMKRRSYQIKRVLYL